MNRKYLAACAVAAFAWGVAMDAAAATVTVLRGGAVEIVAVGDAAGAPTVLRGGGSQILPIAGPETGAPDGYAGHPLIAAGRTLWLVDAAGERITACYLRGTGYIGKRRIVCTGY